MAGKTLGFCVRIYCLSASSGTKKIKTVLRFWVSLWKAWLCKFLNSSPNLKPICDGVFTLNTPGSVTLVIIMGWRRKTLPGGGGHWNADAILVLTGAHELYLGVDWGTWILSWCCLGPECYFERNDGILALGCFNHKHIPPSPGAHTCRHTPTTGP